MDAGRDLDALIAAKVMGWSETHIAYCWHYEAGDPGKYLPRFSTDPTAAWEVVEHLRPRFTNFLLTVSTADPKVIGWWVAGFWDVVLDSSSVTGIYGTRNVATGRSDTAPHAICLAALEAAGGLVPA